jgi:UDP-N-acetyl-D-galactosamine dehydrogenase
VAEKTVKLLIKGKRQVRGAIVAILGLTFKENVPDLRNTKVVDIIRELKDYGVNVRVHDPMADPEEARRYYGLDLTDWDQLGTVDAVILTVLHDDYLTRGLEAIRDHLHPEYPLLLDVKGAFHPEDAQAMDLHYWRL